MTHLPTRADLVFPGSSEMSARMRAFEWTGSPLGPVGAWPQSLRTAVGIILESAFPMIVLWGEEHVQLYNDGYRDLLGARHPGGLGQPTRECWPEVWAFNEPIYQGVRERGETFRFTDQRLILTRHGAEEEAYFTLSYSPVRREHGEVGGVLVTVLETTERVLTERQVHAQNAEPDARTRALEGFAELTRDLGAHGDPHALIRRAQEVVLSLLPEGFALHYELHEDTWRPRVKTGDLRNPELQAAIDAGLPYASARNLVIPWETRQPHYQDQYELGFDGHAEHLTHVRATATLLVTLHDQPIGVFAVGLFHTRSWSTTDRAVLETVVRSLELALERAQQTRQLDEERAALDALATFNEAVGTQSDVLELARQAVQVVHTSLRHVSTAYYELDGDRWKAKVWSEDLAPEIIAQIQAGVPTDAPNYAEAVRCGSAVFVDGWDAQANQLQSAVSYGAAAFIPFFTGGQPRSMFAVGTRDARAWSEREKTLARAVARGLSLALERADSAQDLQTQNAELDARTRMLEAFVELNRNLSVQSEPDVLIRRAMQVVLPLLPPGYAVYHRIVGSAWHVTVQEGDVGSPQLQAALDAGLPVGSTPTLDRPFRTRAPFFQSLYDPHLDIAPELVRHLTTVATLPVLVNGEVLGNFTVALFRQRHWSVADKAVLETVVRSLGLAIEGWQGVAELARERGKLSAANEELEAFVQRVARFTHAGPAHRGLQ